MNKELYLIGQDSIADYIGVSKFTVSRLCSKHKALTLEEKKNQGLFPAKHICGTYRVNVKDLDDWLNK